jgi:hypothetical protein
MKELLNFDRLSEKLANEQVVKKTQEVEHTFDSSVKPFKGHTLFEINIKTGKIKVAEFIEEKILDWFDALKSIESGWTRNVVKKKDCIYISAASKKSAIKRWKEGKGSASKSEGYLNINDL